MLNQAAQKFIFMVEKITMGLGGGARALPLDPPLSTWSLDTI